MELNNSYNKIKMIHPTAIISESAELAEGVIVGPYAIIEGNTRIGKNTRIASHGIIREHTTLGENVLIDSFAVVGSLPQSRGFDPKVQTGVIIGDGTHIREGATVGRSIYEGKNTIIGKNCLLMNYSHVGHDCILKDNVNLANCVSLGGHTEIDNNVWLGGYSGTQQRVRIGENAMLSERSSLLKDAPPFLMVDSRNGIRGLNLVGIKRRGFSREEVSELKACFLALYSEPCNPYQKAKLCKEEGLGQRGPAKVFLDFFEKESTIGCLTWRQNMEREVVANDN